MLKKSLSALLLALLLCGFALGEELLVNGSFEDLDAEGLPRGWSTDAYRTQEGFSRFSVAEDAEAPDGTHCAVIENFTENDARFAQEVRVKPETLYRLSGWIRADNVPEAGHGANLSIAGIYVFSDPVYTTDGAWQYVEMYGETGEDQTSLTVFARLGGYSGESEGKACFDALSLTEVESVPGDGVAALWFQRPTYEDDGNDADWEDWDEDDTVEAEPAAFWPWLIVIALLWIALTLVLLPVYCAQPELTGETRRGPPVLLVLALLLALAARLVLSCFVRGYDVDVGCFTAWGHTMDAVGAGSFYTTTSFCDYPPAYLWVLGLCSRLAALFDSEALTRLCFRLVPALCDVGAALALYCFSVRRGAGRRTASLLSLLLAFSPALILNTACWGQMDSVLCVCLLGVAWLAIERKWLPLMPLYMLAVLLKPQALMLGPLGLVAILHDAVKHREDVKPMLIGTGLALLAAAAIILPFSPGQQPLWIIDLYTRTLQSYPYATVNTANLYYLLGGNWSAVAEPAHRLAPVLLGLGCVLTAMLLYLRGKDRPFRWAEPALLGAFAAAFLVLACTGASWSLVGTLAMAASFALIVPLYLRGGSLKNLPLLGGLLFLLLYVLGVKMHERYLFPAFFLLAMACAVHRDWRLPVLLAVLTATVFVNEGIVLDNSIRLGSAMGHLNYDTIGLARVLSLVNVLAVPFGIWTACDLILHGRARTLPALRLRTVPADRPREDAHDPSLHWTHRDTALVLAVTLAYSVLAFVNLGSTKAPQTAWKSTAKTESIVFDLGENPEAYRVLYFGQVSYSDFRFEFSEDGETWEESVWAQMDQGECWRWKYLVYYSATEPRTYYTTSEPLTFTARYVRLNAEQVGLVLNEVIFRTPEGRVLPASVLRREGENADSPLLSDPAALLDEQDTLQGEPSWFNSTYFDEIYHARTAYEHLHGQTPYETTHPPLGKLLMSVCVAIFGMTPFGWRFAGALTGVLMLPAMYLLAKQLTKRRLPAFTAMSLMALDCMHFTQTRIATIDSFPVLFIICAFFFMLRFMQRDVLRAPLRSLLPDLFGSGLFMGLSIASKWIGCYAGAGLAVLFFWRCIRALYAAKEAGCTRRDAWKRVLLLCAWCLLFFVLIPLGIYLLCYIPYFAYARIRSLPAFLKRVLEAQQGMLSYHSTPGLGMDHPFYSPWYEWPLIRRPMFYAMAAHVPDGWSYAIFAFGNPAVWLPGLAGIVLTAVWWCARHIYRQKGSPALCHLRAVNASPAVAFVLIGFLAQFLPWVPVPRGTYIYHYFASVPFLCLSLSLLLNRLHARFPKAEKAAVAALLAAALVFFIGFYPYASGCLTPTPWLDFMRNFLHVYY